MLSARKVSRILGISATGVREMAEAGRFPGAIPVAAANGAVFWKIPSGDVEALKADLRREHAERLAARKRTTEKKARTKVARTVKRKAAVRGASS